MASSNKTFRLPLLYPILDTTFLASRSITPLAYTEAVLAGGAEILQFRHKSEFTREIFALSEEIGRLVRNAGAQFIINDRSDLAALLDAGLHVGQDDLPPARARTILGPNRPLGFSTHNPIQLEQAAAEPLDYVAFGPIFTTSAKLRPDPTVGVDTLRTHRALSSRPLVAIGGITCATAQSVLAAGADSLAVISDLVPPGATPADIRIQTETWRAVLQSASRALR